MEMKTEHLGVYVNDLQKSLEFYQKLGFTKHFLLFNFSGEPTFLYLKSSSELFFLELIHSNGDCGTQEKKTRHLCLEVDDAAAAARELQEKGVDVFYGPVSYKNKADIPYTNKVAYSMLPRFFVADPDGNQIEFIQF